MGSIGLLGPINKPSPRQLAERTIAGEIRVFATGCYGGRTGDVREEVTVPFSLPSPFLSPYHSNETVLELKELGLRGYLSEPDRGRRNWKGKNRKYQAPVYANRRRIRGRRGRRLQRRRSELVERPFAHQFATGGLRRIFVRGHANVRKRLLIHVSGFNLGLLMRRLTGVGTPRSLQGRVLARLFTLLGAPMDRWIGWNRLGERFWASIRSDGKYWASRTHQ